MRIAALITDAPTIRDLRTRVREPAAPPRIAPARGMLPEDRPDAQPGALAAEPALPTRPHAGSYDGDRFPFRAADFETVRKPVEDALKEHRDRR